MGIYIGIKQRKDWSHLVLWLSYWGLAITLLEFLTIHTDVLQLLMKGAINALALCFHFYSIIIFSKGETKEYFRYKGKVIF
jgi:hypothetical protein